MVVHDLAVLIGSSGIRSNRTGAAAYSSTSARAAIGGRIYSLRSDAAPFALRRPVDSLQIDAADVLNTDATRFGGDEHFYLVHGGVEASDVESELSISELDAPTYAFIKQLFVEPWQQPANDACTDAPSTSMTPDDSVAVDALLESQVLVPTHA